ncbi:uncharacterized protein GGS22DRAFT_73138 [Annulohypoxylon maeteangense]|uniref:uncharacterized protein n=1 Tax=Annulohypoxylon maeteangense TaxID=1927788 RepID=UPI0020077F4D|nr:uncharacterized protein GGS22DRAFT_73138 [Annulohypoxylon maeteangense]KAI0881274.1 hypothetical protein GGS22DRAFT_73138 [Annulohypoxylon maeteangense]
MDPNNPLSDREKALESQYIKEKEKQLAKARATKKNEDKEQQSQPKNQPTK